MKLQPIVDELVDWCACNSIEYNVSCYDKNPPKASLLRKAEKLHPALVELYEDTNGVLVGWEDEGLACQGSLDVPDVVSLHAEAKSTIKNTRSWSDKAIMQTCHDCSWWADRIPLFRSMVKIYDEGNGDYVAVSRLDDKVYYIFHDWMDWVSEEPPIIEIADSIREYVLGWAQIRFACSKDYYWMNAVKDGVFTGFNGRGFNVWMS